MTDMLMPGFRLDKGESYEPVPGARFNADA
jgi:hypothetical protein